jgi:hypothetical protein
MWFYSEAPETPIKPAFLWRQDCSWKTLEKHQRSIGEIGVFNIIADQNAAVGKSICGRASALKPPAKKGDIYNRRYLERMK